MEEKKGRKEENRKDEKLNMIKRKTERDKGKKGRMYGHPYIFYLCFKPTYSFGK